MMAETTLELDNLFMTIQDPYPVYAYLRENDPVRKLKMAVETPEFRLNYSLRGLTALPVVF